MEHVVTPTSYPNSKAKLAIVKSLLPALNSFVKRNKALALSLSLVTLLVLTAYSSPLLRVYSVPLSDDIQAILVKHETRTFLDILPEYVTSKLYLKPSISRDPYQKQAILNAYGASLRVMGIKTEPGLLIAKSEKYQKGNILPFSILYSKLPQSSKELIPPSSKSGKLQEEEPAEEYIYLNNTTYPNISIPSILTLAQGNSDTLALTLYFLERELKGNWNNSYTIKITGALDSPADYSKVTRIGSAKEKSTIDLEEAFLILPLGNKEDLKTNPVKSFYISDLKELITKLCTLPGKGTLCSNPKILEYIK